MLSASRWLGVSSRPAVGVQKYPALEAGNLARFDDLGYLAGAGGAHAEMTDRAKPLIGGVYHVCSGISCNWSVIGHILVAYAEVSNELLAA